MPLFKGKRWAACLGMACLVLLFAVAVNAQNNGITLTAITPQQVTIGAGIATISLSGSGFTDTMGLQLISRSPYLQVLSLTASSFTSATAVVMAVPGAQPGPVRLDLRDNFGNNTFSQATPPLVLISANAISAPLAVRDAAIVYPQPGTLLAPGNPIFARAILATSGSGVIVGTFALDGVTYDQFTVVAGAGAPVQVESKMPIPFTSGGTHDLQLQILSPRPLVSGTVRLIGVPESRTALQLISPADGSSASAPAPFRWTMVPGATAYEVLIGRQPFDVGARVWRTSLDSWTPTDADWAGLGSGDFYWTVRPIFAGEVIGTGPSFRRVVLFTGAFTLSVGAPLPGPRPSSLVLNWSGAPEGALYFLEFFPSGGGQRLFTAFTRAPKYLLRFPAGSSDLDYTVTAFDASGVRLGEPAKGTAIAPRSSVQGKNDGVKFAAGPVAVTGLSPKDGASVNSSQPPIGATWSGNVAQEDVAIFVGSSDVTGMAVIQAGRFTYTPVLPLPEGATTVKLTLGDVQQAWSFTVKSGAPAAAASTPSATPAGEPAAPRAEKTSSKEGSKPSGAWTAQVGGTGTEISGSRPDQQDTFRATLSSQSDIGSGGYFFKDTADAAFRHDFTDPSRTVSESRNWLFSGGYKGANWGAEGQVGYGSVDILGDSQLVTSGLARGGAEVKLNTLAGQFGAYSSFDNTTPSLGSASGSSDMRVRAASYALPLPSDKYTVRLMGLWTDQDASAYLPGGSGRVFGILGKFAFSPQLSMYLEAAQGRTSPDGGTETQGNAYRLGFGGVIYGTSYTLNFRRVASTFSNAANPGYSQGGVPDRSGADLSLSRVFGKLATSFTYRYAKDGVGDSMSGSSNGTQNATTLTFSLPVGTALSFMLSLNGERDRGGENALYPLPGTKRNIYGWTLGSTQRASKLFFSETYTGQRVKDDLNPTAKMNMDSFVLTMGGNITTSLGVAATGSYTRSKGAALVGTTDLYVFSLSPYWNIESWKLTIMPRAMYTKTKNDLGTIDTRMEQYGLTIQWSPTWMRSLMALQGTAEWNSNKTGVAPVYPVPPGTYMPPSLSDHRYLLSLTIHWGGGKGTLNDRYTQPGMPGTLGAGAAPSPIPPSGYNQGGMGL
jgi:hypothetical protein